MDRVSRETAVRTASQYHIQDQKVFVNFIPTTIYDPKYCLQTTLELANTVGFDPANLVFEVVESYKVTDLDHLKSILDYYKSRGFKTALDDVGSGFSNLNSLVRLRPDYLKVDMELVRHIHVDSMKQSVFKALDSIAKENGITLLAEGVETKEELDFLISRGTDLAQGYYLGKPAPKPLSNYE
ncbi:MAG: EAL domain-containing protein [Spirochaetes bacterium]|nr:EAL domain-containing protein [Spirochaetota bacterium]